MLAGSCLIKNLEKLVSKIAQRSNPTKYLGCGLQRRSRESGSFGSPADLEAAFAEEGEEEEKEGSQATFFESQSPPTVVMAAAGSDDGVDRDVDDLFDNLIDD